MICDFNPLRSDACQLVSVLLEKGAHPRGDDRVAWLTAIREPFLRALRGADRFQDFHGGMHLTNEPDLANRLLQEDDSSPTWQHMMTVFEMAMQFKDDIVKHVLAVLLAIRNEVSDHCNACYKVAHTNGDWKENMLNNLSSTRLVAMLDDKDL